MYIILGTCYGHCIVFNTVVILELYFKFLFLKKVKRTTELFQKVQQTTELF